MLKTWISKLSLQTQFLVLTVLLSSMVLIVTDWVTTVSSVHTVEGTTGAQTTQAARCLGTYLEKSSAAHLPSEFRNQVLEILELEPNITRVDVYADFSGELKSVESSSSRGDRPLEGQEIRAFI